MNSSLRLSALLLLLVSGCSSQPPAQVKATAAHRELMVLPSGARLDATLEDVSKGVVIGRARVNQPGNPTAFLIPYDPARIDPKGQYAVRARIVAGGQLLFVTRQHYPLDEVVSLTLRRAGTDER
jgi:uncharacterized lipoprotein YbaY